MSPEKTMSIGSRFFYTSLAAGRRSSSARMFGRRDRPYSPVSLPIHKSAGVRSAVEAAGATLRHHALHPPPATLLSCAERSLLQAPPELDPIGQAFSKLKALLRKAAARAIPDLYRSDGIVI